MPRDADPAARPAGVVAALDTDYQDAVARNDPDAMGRILTEDFVLISSTDRTLTRDDLLAEARGGRVRYEQQDDTDRTVRVSGDTAVLTALLWAKGTEDGRPFTDRVWFSDTYARLECR